MIFKINFNTTLFNQGKQNIYISFCESKMQLGITSFRMFLHKLLCEKKILNVPYGSFTYDMPLSVSGRLIKCFVITNTKPKLYCKLEQLMPYAAPYVEPYANSLDRRYDIIKAINKRAAESIATEIDNEILFTLDNIANPNRIRDAFASLRTAAVVNPTPAPIRRSVDYNTIARRTFLVEDLPAAAAPIYNLDIEAPVVMEYPQINVAQPEVEIMAVDLPENPINEQNNH